MRMRLHGALSDEEPPTNLGVRQPFADQYIDLLLPSRESCDRVDYRTGR